MAIAITKLYEFAKLATASYVDLTDAPNLLSAVLSQAAISRDLVRSGMHSAGGGLLSQE